MHAVIITTSFTVVMHCWTILSAEHLFTKNRYKHRLLVFFLLCLFLMCMGVFCFCLFVCFFCFCLICSQSHISHYYVRSGFPHCNGSQLHESPNPAWPPHLTGGLGVGGVGGCLSHHQRRNIHNDDRCSISARHWIITLEVKPPYKLLGFHEGADFRITFTSRYHAEASVDYDSLIPSFVECWGLLSS